MTDGDDRMQQESRMNLPLAQSPGHPTAAPGVSAPPVLDSQDLLCGRNAVTITHNGALYRLQTTRQGKLILTK